LLLEAEEPLVVLTQTEVVELVVLEVTEPAL
jgi:hypothetical protein